MQAPQRKRHRYLAELPVMDPINNNEAQPPALEHLSDELILCILALSDVPDILAFSRVRLCCIGSRSLVSCPAWSKTCTSQTANASILLHRHATAFARCP